MGLGNLTTGAKAAGVLVVIVAIVLAILENFQTTTVVALNATHNATVGSFFTYQGAAYNSVGSGITAIDDFITWLAIIILVMVGAYLLKKVSTAM